MGNESETNIGQEMFLRKKLMDYSNKYDELFKIIEEVTNHAKV